MLSTPNIWTRHTYFLLVSDKFPRKNIAFVGNATAVVLARGLRSSFSRMEEKRVLQAQSDLLRIGNHSKKQKRKTTRLVQKTHADHVNVHFSAVSHYDSQ
jgi:hypothetical protein